MYSKPIALAIFAFAMTGCSSTATQAPATADTAPATSPTRGGECNASAVQNIIGNAYSERAVQNALQRSGAGSLRVLQPGQVMTMEYNPSRLTIVIDDAQTIASARCG